MNRRTLAISIAALALACSETPSPETLDGGAAGSANAHASARLDTLRHDFHVHGTLLRSDGSQDDDDRPLLPRSDRHFIADGGRLLAPTLAGSPELSVARLASGMTILRDPTSGIRLGITITSTVGAPATLVDGAAYFPRALGDGDLVRQLRSDGLEDFFALDTKPAASEIVYHLDVAAVPGVRFVGGVLEFLDQKGVPRLRMPPGRVVDSTGTVVLTETALEGCSVDEDPRDPRTRPVVAHGDTCLVHVRWPASIQYPALVDPAWTATQSLPVAVNTHAATLLQDGRVLVTSGYLGAGKYTPVASLFDPATNTFATTGSLPAGRSHHGSSLLGSGKVLVFGGEDFNGSLASAFLYDPVTGTFSPTGSMGTPRSRFAFATLASGKVLVTGNSQPVASAELYDPTTGVFTPTGSMLLARWTHSATRLPSGKVLIAGGLSVNYTDTAELYDPQTGTFSATGSMGVKRGAHQAVLLPSGKVLIVSGVDNNGFHTPSCELYDPLVGTFAPAGSLALGRWGHRATLLQSGKVLVTGGEGLSGPPFDSVEIYDPGTDAFSPVGPMTVGHYLHTATLLDDGRVLVTAGGRSQTSVSEVFARVPAGETCAANNDCLSGTCQNGICCASACNGACLACTPGTGACVPIASADDADSCTGPNTCDANALCKLKNGLGCGGQPTSCASGFCADGLCCDAACAAGGCDRCDLKGSLGTCTIAPQGNAGSNPACAPFVCNGVATSCPTSCATDADCGTTHFCDSAGQCSLRKQQASPCNPSVNCKVSGCRECQSNACVDGVCCDGACGTQCMACTAALKQSGPDGVCGPAKEGTNPHGDACPAEAQATCGADGTCNGFGGCRSYQKGTSCGASSCNGTIATGQICNGLGACGSDSVDCAPHACKNGGCVKPCTSGTDCAAGFYCDGGTCKAKLPKGSTCTTEEACASGFCTDGYCCTAACTGQCEACDAKGLEGQCSPVVGASHPGRAKCAPSTKAPCAHYACNGQRRDACEQLAVTCGAYACTDDGTCSTQCTTDGECSAGSECNGGKCTPRPADGCACTQSGQRSSGGGGFALLSLAVVAYLRRRRSARASFPEAAGRAPQESPR